MSTKSTTPAATAQEIAQHGWAAVPVDSEAIFQGKDYLHKTDTVTMEEMPFPHDDPIVQQIYQYAKEKLPALAFNHSMRVYHFSIVILKYQFPEFAQDLSHSTIALAAILHDIGTVDEFIKSTLLSFEWWGGYHSLQLLKEHGSSSQQAEAVAEAIIRHQDIGTEGTITFLGQLLQLSTIYDNMGFRPALVDDATRNAVVSAFPRTVASADGMRETWSNCFAATIRKENGLKPWAHTTHLGESAFPEGVLANGEKGLMSEYEK
jgi:cyanamide hydratase